MVLNTCALRVLLKPQRGETTLFITDMTKANVSLPRTIKWDEVTLPEKWVMDKATPSVPRLAPTIEQIKQNNSGKVEITFNRRNSFSSRIEASRSEYESTRRSFSRINLKGVGFFNILKVQKENKSKKNSEFFERVKINIPFFDWFHAYTIKENLDYPWKQDIIGDPTTNVITNWQIKDGELIQSELPPATQYQLPKVKDSNDKPVMATPFKTKDVNEDITSKDIKSLMEQANYTKKYLQVLGESINREKIEKPLFKPFKVSEKARQKIREFRKTKERGKSNFKRFSANNIYECNIDAQTEYNIMNTLQHMTMVATTYQTTYKCSKETIIDILVAGFSGQLKGCAIKTDLNGKVITNDDNKEIPDAVNTLIFTIAQHFIGDPSFWKDRTLESDQFPLLNDPNKACIYVIKPRSVALNKHSLSQLIGLARRVYTREDSQQPFWKKNFLAGLPRSLGDKVRDKIRCQSVNGGIPYESLSYGQLISLKKKLRNLYLDPSIEEHINNLLIETSEEETEGVSSEENLNIIQQDDQPLSTDDEDTQEINTITKEQDLLFKAINSIPDPQEKKVFLNKLKKSLETKPKPRDTMALFGTGADSNCILEGLVTTKFFEKTSEKISTENGSKLKINYKLSSAIIKNQGLRIETNFLQELPKNPTLKQTKDDYAFPIQTLLDLQEIGLTKLTKKTWADIASESDDESEIDLKTLIQKTKESKVVCNISKGEQTLNPTTKRETPTQKSTNDYIYKNKFSTVLQMKPEDWDKNPFKATTKAFPSGFHFKPTAINKTRTFYEFILIDSNSVSIKHFKDPNDPSSITHSTIQILKMYNSQESQIPTDLKYFSSFALSWIFSWQYRYSKMENNKQFPSLQRHAFVKWWNQFDASKAEPGQVKIWFKAHLEFLKAADPETSLFLNRKSQLAAFLVGSNPKEHLTKNLKEVLKLLQSQEEGSSSSKKEDTNSSENDDDFYQNEEDCFGICLYDI
uniref:DUF7746 domain-containing protein n=1 Tax=Glycine max TaxID=3847 RepID=A0A0R0JTA5_SOYBN